MRLFAKLHDPLETDVTELEQQLTCTQERSDFFLGTISSLFFYIKDFSLDLVDLESHIFKYHIDEISNLYKHESDIHKIKMEFDESKYIIEDFIGKEKICINDREDEYKNLIEVLTRGIYDINSDNKEFNASMYKSSENIERIRHLHDIRRIKQELKQEIEEVKQCIRNKQNREAELLKTLTHQLDNLKVDLEQAKHASMIDGLTGIFNRQALDARVGRMVEQSTSTRAPFCLLMLDIDRFKQINDTYGHPVGDRVILAIVQKCRGEIRKDDFLARYGGEEFAFILPTASLRHGVKKARAICKAIASSRYRLEQEHSLASLSFTVSIGVSTFRPGDTAASIVERADKALYEAKRLGRNRAVSEKQVS